jgi:hypothetical protein
MKKLTIIFLLLIGGCVSVPVDRKFPAVPENLMEPAPNLKTLNVKNPQLSDIINNANDNYAEFYKLQSKYNQWINWYNTQKKIFESVD